METESVYKPENEVKKFGVREFCITAGIVLWFAVLTFKDFF